MSGRNPKWIIGIVALLILVTLSWWLLHQRSTVNPAETPVSDSIQTSNAPAELTGASKQNLHAAANELAAAKTTDERAAALTRLREALATGSTNEASLAIRKLLESKLDAPTGQGFKIGGGGSLTEAPTLRTWLLGELGALDPAAAAAYAREILNNSTSPDEWAIALRNLARGDANAGARALLEAKTSELLRNESWQENPSVGYLEAFDTAVHLGGTDLLAPLSDLVRKKDNQAVAHAAFLTLDRLTINQSAEILSALLQHPDWMQGREETRANYFARADVSEEAQRTLVENYLLDPSRSPAELQAFVGIFPNANFMISHNLLTQNATLDGATLRRRDQAALEVVGQWLADGRFEKIKQQLARTQKRLQEFTRQAK